MKISHFQILKAVVDTSSFSAAAAELGCTQSNVSYAIAEIEKYANTKLLHRSRTGCTPTAQGLETIQKGIKLLEIYDDIRNAKKSVSGLVRIACFRSIGATQLAVILHEIAQAHPGIQFEIFDDSEEQTDIVRLLANNKADIAIARDMDEQAFIARPFSQDTYALVVSDQVPDLEQLHSYRQLQDLAFIQHDNSCARAVTAQLRAEGFKPRFFRNVSSAQSVVTSIASCRGFSILPRLAIPHQPAGCRILPLPTEVVREFCVISRPHSLLASATSCVLKYMQERKFSRN